jgi:hypothetical protein
MNFTKIDALGAELFHAERQTRRYLQTLLCFNRPPSPQKRLFLSTIHFPSVYALLGLHSNAELVNCYHASCYDFAQRIGRHTFRSNILPVYSLKLGTAPFTETLVPSFQIKRLIFFLNIVHPVFTYLLTYSMEQSPS